MNDEQRYKVTTLPGGDGFRLDGPALQSITTHDREIAAEFLRIADSAFHMGELTLQSRIRKILGL